MLSSVLLFLNIGTPELMIILFAALLLFGGNKLPELARGLGKGIRDFKDASEDVKREIHNQINSFDEKITEDKAVEREEVSESPVEVSEISNEQDEIDQEPSSTANYNDESKLVPPLSITTDENPSANTVAPKTKKKQRKYKSLN